MIQHDNTTNAVHYSRGGHESQTTLTVTLLTVLALVMIVAKRHHSQENFIIATLLPSDNISNDSISCNSETMLCTVQFTLFGNSDVYRSYYSPFELYCQNCNGDSIKMDNNDQCVQNKYM